MIILTCCSQPRRPGVPPHLQNIEPLIILEPGREGYRIALEREIVFQDSLLLDNIPGVAAGSEGNVFIAGEAWERRHIYKFDRLGNRLATFGGFGTSDGEFYRIDGIQLRNNDLYVFDGELERITRLDTETGMPRQIIKVMTDSNRYDGRYTDHIATPVHSFNHNRFLVRFSENTNPAFNPDRNLVYAMINEEGEPVADSVLVQKDMTYLVGDYAGRPAAFTLNRPEKSLLDVNNEDKVISAWTGEFLIEVYNRDFSFFKAYYKEYMRAPLDKENVVNSEFSHNDQLMRIRQTAEYPEAWPALYSLVTDDHERIWVSTITSDENELEWWVIDQDGEYAQFVWPAGREIVHVQDGYAYVIERDRAGFKDLVRYRISGLE